MIGIVLLWCLNFGISVLNAISVGAVWSEIKATGSGFARFIQWCGAIMAACGFIWCSTILEGLVLHKFGYLSDQQLTGLFSLGYLLIILPVIGSGLGITMSSWMEFARRKTIGNAAVAGYNTFAQVHNTYRAIQGIPTAYRGASDLFSGSGSSRSSSRSSSSSGSSKEGAGGLVVVALLLLAAIAGILTTYGLIRWADRTWVVHMHNQFDSADRRFKKA